MGKDYQYSHNYANNFVDQEFLPKEISGTKIYEPGQNQRESQFRETLKNRWNKRYDY